MKKASYKSRLLSILPIVALIFLGACRKDDLDVDLGNEGEDDMDLIDLPDWSEETHGSSSDPDDWSDMQNDLGSLFLLF